MTNRSLAMSDTSQNDHAEMWAKSSSKTDPYASSVILRLLDEITRLQEALNDTTIAWEEEIADANEWGSILQDIGRKVRELECKLATITAERE